MPEAERNAAPSLLYAVKRLELAVRARLDDVLHGSGVTTLQYTALTVLEQRGGTSAAQLARDSFVTPQSMADLLRALEQRGLVHRSTNPLSRRELLVDLSDAGRALLRDYEARAAGVVARLVEGMDGDQEQAFRSALSQGWRNLRDDAPGSSPSSSARTQSRT